MVKRKQISVGGLHRARSPDHSQQSSLREPVPNLSSLRVFRSPNGGVGWEVESRRPGGPRQTDTTIRSQRQDGWGGGAGEFTAASRPGPSQQAALGPEPYKTVPQPVLWAPSLPAAPRPGELEGSQGEGWDPLYLTFHLMTATPPTVG